MRTHIFNVSAISPADHIKIQMSFFLILFFLPSLNWEREREREYVIAILRKGGRENSLKVYLAFRQVPSESIFSFTGLRDFIQLGLKASIISLSKILSAFPRNFGDSFNTSYHANCYLETRLCFFARSLASDPRPLTATSFLKNDFLIPISADEKGATSALGLWPIIWPLSSSFTLSGDSFGLLYVPIPPSLSIRLQRATSLGFQSDLDLLLRPRGIDLHSLSLF